MYGGVAVMCVAWCEGVVWWCVDYEYYCFILVVGDVSPQGTICKTK